MPTLQAMVAVGVVLLEGIGVSLSKEGALRGLDSLKRAKVLFYSERRPPFSPYIGGRFPHMSDFNSVFRLF